jgi:predicted amino acid racemase
MSKQIKHLNGDNAKSISTLNREGAKRLEHARTGSRTNTETKKNSQTNNNQ